jgi:hypothetical protein
MFFRKKALHKRTAFAALSIVFLALVISCPHPGSTTNTEGISISSSADMAKIGVDPAYPLSASYVLANDITLTNFTPIGGSNPFSGVFDGNNKTITVNSFSGPVGNSSVIPLPNRILTNTGPTLTPTSYDKVFLGIFASVKGTASQKAEIKNLSIHSSVSAVVNEDYGTAVGLVAGYAELAVIDNITLSGTFEFKSESGKTAYVGGVAGIIVGDAEPEGQVAGTNAGVIIKNCNSSMTMDIKPGYGSPLVVGIPNPFSWVGGFAGFFMNGGGIENCHNTGDVNGVNDWVNASQLIVGGIAGGSHYAYSMAFQGYIQDSSSTGNIKVGARGFWPFAGGIAGTVCGGQGTRENSTRIERCYATGTVSIENVLAVTSGSQWPYIGGIVGYVYSGAWVSQCYFSGTVIVDRNNDYTGGIAGYSSFATGGSAELVCVIEDCWSDGEVKGYNNAGGIVGQNQQNTLLWRSYSRMTVSITNGSTSSSAQWGIGGIVGSHSSSNPDDAMLACVALNPSITAVQTTELAERGAEIHRIAGRMQNAGNAATPVWPKMTNVYALPDLLPVTGSDNYVEDKGTDRPDGADIPIEYISNGKPIENFYIEVLEWDFNNVWKMGADGYPKLQWQQ